MPLFVGSRPKIAEVSSFNAGKQLKEAVQKTNSGKYCISMTDPMSVCHTILESSSVHNVQTSSKDIKKKITSYIQHVQFIKVKRCNAPDLVCLSKVCVAAVTQLMMTYTSCLRAHLYCKMPMLLISNTVDAEISVPFSAGYLKDLQVTVCCYRHTACKPLTGGTHKIF